MKALSLSSQEYILMLNSDDFFVPEGIDKLYEFLIENKLELAYGKMAIKNLLFSISEALQTVVIGPVDTGKSLRASTVQRHLLSQWSKNLEDQLTNLAEKTSPEEYDFSNSEAHEVSPAEHNDLKESQ